MDPHLQSIYDLLQKASSLSGEEKESILLALKDSDKAQGLTKFKLDRLERDRQTLSVMLEESIGDLEKKSKAIEEQNLELEIESALERVRSVAMGMNKPEDMLEICSTISHQLILLHVKELRNIQTAIFYENRGTYMNYQYYAKHDKSFITDTVYTDHEVGRNFAAKMLEGKGEFYITHITGRNEVDSWIAYQKSTNVFIDDYLYTALSLSYYWYSLGPVALGISTYSPLTQDQEELFKRFVTVFELAYRRYLDIEKAEAQAKEAKIEASLERVRARSMGMHQSKDLHGVINVISDRLQQLGFHFDAVNFATDFSPTGYNMWLASPGETFPEQIHVPRLEYKGYHQLDDAIRQGKDFFSYTLTQEEKNNFFKHFFENTVARNTPEESKQHVYSSKGMAASVAILKKIILSILNFQGTPYTEDENNIIKRFAAVFEQSYTRFLDLQKAEAQAREAQIEVALEKVRSRTMAMQKSDELGDVAIVLFKELNSLVKDLWTCGFVLCEKDRAEDEWWLSTESGFIPAFYLPNVGDATHYNIYQGWLKGEEYHTEQLEGEALQKHYDWLMNIPATKKIFDDFAAGGYERPRWQKLHCAYFSKGYLCIITREPCPEEDVFKRFAQVFDLTYTRFLDLQKAEAQTREALIEGALERVRARALAMQQPEELKEVAQVLRNEMGALGVEELETSSIYIHGDSSTNVECWYALQDPKHTEKKMVADHFVLNLDDTWVGREMKKFYLSKEKQISVVMQGANRREWIEYCYSHSPAFTGFYGEIIPDRTYHLYKFSHGYIGAAAPGDISAESWKLLSRAASVFSLAYSRFKDLTQARSDLIQLKEEKKRAEDALTELQATQKQLIQSEKMASLGELTAGIAHEIQNPLNFVNNFSEVSNELLEEMKEELAKGNNEDAIAIAEDVKQNLEKINHHGKRADAIVKGMLQHSRTSSGQKEPTDINALADEYLRLAYHGLRAKDKSFNAKFETDFDSSIGKINMVPQEIGRVILNLINNAFYAVGEKKKLVNTGYEPTVTVTSAKRNGKIELSVTDNGNGMPQKVLDKIFQPFFTTKPTGQGTGLGLSLSYDIITKGHDGDIKVDTKEGEGTTFILSIPAN